MDPLTTISTRRTPQSEQADPRQVQNSAGGFTFKVSDETRVHRFLTMGTAGGTFYASEQEVTKDAAGLILNVARTRGEWLVEQIVTVSTAGRAPRQNPAIFALAVVSGLGDDNARKAAREALPAVCRTGTHLLIFVKYVEQFRGWGRGLRRAVSDWYLSRSVDEVAGYLLRQRSADDVAYQMVKYRQREGWAQRDLLRLAHPKPAADDLTRRALFEWAVGRSENGATEKNLPPEIVIAFELAQRAHTPQAWATLIAQYPSLSWEMLPDAALTEPKVWRALIEQGMPQTALIRQLPRLTWLGVLDDPAVRHRVAAQLTDAERLRRGRVHPVNVLVAQRTYASGRSVRGSSTWTPKRQIVDALDTAFYQAFGAIEPAGKRTLLALDISGSMDNSAGDIPISCRELAAAIGLVIVATEPSVDVVGFTADGWSRPGARPCMYFGVPAAVSELDISPRRRLDDVTRYTASLPMGGTDCALPMVWATAEKRDYDTFVIITDNETWAGDVHPHQALGQYRNERVKDARLVVVALTPTRFSIADPADPGQLDVSGFDSVVPNLIADFSRGDV